MRRQLERIGATAIMALVLAAGPSGAQPANQKLDRYWQKFETKVAGIAAEFDGVMTVAVKDLSDGRSYYLDADEVMPTASMIKIAVLVDLFRRNKLDEKYVVAKSDALAGDDILSRLTPGVSSLTWRDVAVLMVAVSDNSATNVLIDRLGMASINGTLDSLGLRATRLRRRMLDLEAAKAGRENVATSRETVALLEAIYRGKAFPKTQFDAFWDILGMHKEGYLNADLPEGAMIANKPGWLDGVRTDAALGLPKTRPFAITVMTTYATNDPAAERAIARIGRLAYEFFDRLGRSSEYGRVIQ